MHHDVLVRTWEALSAVPFRYTRRKTELMIAANSAFAGSPGSLSHVLFQVATGGLEVLRHKTSSQQARAGVLAVAFPTCSCM